VQDRMCSAGRRQGAFVNGERIHARTSGEQIPVAGLSTKYLPPELREEIEQRAEGKMRCVGIPRCAAEQYPRVMLGTNDLALFWRTHVWDHAPGALIVQEAGGKVARFDDTPYDITKTGKGLLAAASPAMWDEAAAILLG